jgi:fatty-acyl-CoA synthase
MSEKKIVVTPAAYAYPLLIKQLLHTPLTQSPQQEIVYRDLQRLTYIELRGRIGRLASALAKIGVRPGDTVGVLDWDSNRFLEAFFAIPMMGAVLQTVNVRLSPEQVAYTIDHAASSTLLVNDEFVDLVHSILPKLPKVRQLVVISDRKAPATGELQFVGEYEELLAAASPDYRFPDFDENVQATTFYTTGTTGLPKGVYYSHRQVVLHVMAELVLFGLAAKQGRFHRDDVYMPITPMFHVHAWGFPWAATLAGVKQVYPGRYDPALLIKLIKTEGVTFTHGVPTILQMLLDAAGECPRRSRRPEDADWRFGPAGGARQAGVGSRDRRLHGLRHVGDRPAGDGGASPVQRSFRRSGAPDRVTHQGGTRLPAGRSTRRRHRNARIAP